MYTRAIEHDRHCIAAYIGRGNTYFEHGSAALQPDEGEAMQRGTVADKAERRAAARQDAWRRCCADYQRALHMAPDCIPANVNLAVALSSGRPGDRNAQHSALTLLHSALRVEPSNPAGPSKPNQTASLSLRRPLSTPSANA